MADAYFAAACVGLLIALAYTCLVIRHQQKQINGWRENAFHEMQVAEDHMQHAWELEDERSEILEDVGMLESLLKAARKNDNRDARGRFVSAAN